MAIAANIIVALVALLHIYFLVLLCSVVVAGVYGAATASRKILFVQALPAAIGLALMWMA